MKGNGKRLLLLFAIILIDFILVLTMRMIVPKIFWVNFGIIVLITLGSIYLYFMLIKPEKWLKESTFVSLVLMLLTFALTVILHGLIEHNLKLRNFSVALVTLVIPYICGKIYSLRCKSKMRSTNQS